MKIISQLKCEINFHCLPLKPSVHYIHLIKFLSMEPERTNWMMTERTAGQTSCRQIKVWNYKITNFFPPTLENLDVKVKSYSSRSAQERWQAGRRSARWLTCTWTPLTRWLSTAPPIQNQNTKSEFSVVFYFQPFLNNRSNTHLASPSSPRESLHQGCQHQTEVRCHQWSRLFLGNSCHGSCTLSLHFPGLRLQGLLGDSDQLCHVEPDAPEASWSHRKVSKMKDLLFLGNDPFRFVAPVFPTWNVLLPHLRPQSGIVTLSFLLIRTRRLMHAQEGQGQGHARVGLQHIWTVVADGVHR